MSKAKLVSLFCLAAVITGGTVSCGFLEGGPLVRIWSQTAEILPYIDRFNNVQNKYKIEVSYVSSPAEELLPSQTVPDLILSECLSAPRCAVKLENLAPLLHGNGLDEKQFYRELFVLHHYQNAAVVLPFSFRLPVVVFRPGVFPKGAPDNISLDDLKSSGRAFTKTSNGVPYTLGFSPLWNQDFLFDAASLFGVDFHAEPGRPLAWRDEQLQEWVSFLSDWCETADGGFTAESEFVKKYLYGAPYQLIQAGIPQPKKAEIYRISFFRALAGDFFAIPADKRKNLGMAWLSRNGKIPADDGILFFGVPRGAKNRGGAYEFIKWALSAATQRSVLEENAKKNPLSFGIAGGFSSLVDVNEKEFPIRWPLLKGRIPVEKELIFNGPLPENWQKLKNEVVLPWVFGRLSHAADQAPLNELIK
ncbi:MAG: extracellular solute-binding protein [Spirochaetales bacterium]|nr:extracellular solute-binding protein [Spirochaetales bacterium]